MELANFKNNAMQYLSVLHSLLEEGQKMGMDLSPIINKLESVEKSIKDGIIRIVLLGTFSDGKTTTIAGLLGQLEDTMKIDLDESSDELTVYQPLGLKKGFEIVDTPGLFGTKEKEIDGKNIKFSEITERYISEAHLLIYVCDAVTPLKDSHAEIIRRVLRDYGKLDTTVFVINKMDEAGYNLKDDTSFNNGANIKKQTLIGRLRNTIGLTSEEESRLNIVCIAADPKGKGLSYWFDKMEEYQKYSRIAHLRGTIDNMIEQSDEAQLKDSTLVASVKDMVVGLYREIEGISKPVEHALINVKDSIEDLRIDSNSLKTEIMATRKDAVAQLDNLKDRIISRINGASVETIGTVIEQELGLADGKINFYIFDRNVNTILAECSETNNSTIQAAEVKFEKSFDEQDGMLKDAIGKGANALGKIKINGGQVKAIRDIVAKNYKFKPWGAVKWADKGNKILGRAGAVLAVVLEAWSWWSSYKDNKRLNELKKELKDSVNNALKDLYDLFANEQKYYESFAPSYLQLLKALDERNKEIETMQTQLASYNDYRERLKRWYGNDIEDVDFEEL